MAAGGGPVYDRAMTIEADRRPPALEPEIEALLRELKARLERRFGERFVALWLFGSRARGDHEPDSDVDVAVILDQEIAASRDAKEGVLDITYELMLERGHYIQPWILEKGALDQPAAHPHAQISRAVLRDGVPV
jgi:uncharacterized protein